MCGIAGIVSHDRRELINKMTSVLAHRGPDGEGYYADGSIALGQRRLSIIDLDGGKQPIGNEDGTLQLVCNGEIYNSPELRERLLRAGHVFKTKTDVEVILHLYEDHGPDCVKYLRGMFAFAVWDSVKRTLFLARDHLGQKPLFFYHNGSEFLFASEVKSILASGLIRPEIDLDGLWHYISLRFIPDRYSLFKGIQKLPAATSLLLNKDGIHVQRYWELDFNNKVSGTEQEIEEGLHALLLDTVRMHLLSDVRVGAFLSGGIDSTTISAMMASTTNDRVPTFSIGVKEEAFNELPYARLVAEKYGFESHEKIVQPDLIHLMPSMIYHMDEPSDPFGFGVYLVSQLAAQTVKVALSGDGGDENFAGYDRYAGQRAVDYYCLLPRWFRNHIMQPVIRRIPESFGYKSLAQKATWIHQLSSFSHGERYAQSMSFLRFTNAAKERLFTEAARKRVQDSDSLAKILVHFNSGAAEHPVDKMLYTDLMTRIPDHNMVIDDRMSMAHSLETRAPFVDYRLVEYAASIPAQIKLKGMGLKHILRRVASRYLPDELVYRKKQGFGFPLGIWMRTDLKQYLKNLFAESRFVEHGMFDGAYIQQLLTEHLEGKADHNFRLWLLMNLEFWYRLYFENETIDALQEATNKLMAGTTTTHRRAGSAAS
jgi:asparagine synthase (glutamine-hydrolysing)